MRRLIKIGSRPLRRWDINVDLSPTEDSSGSGPRHEPALGHAVDVGQRCDAHELHVGYPEGGGSISGEVSSRSSKALVLLVRPRLCSRFVIKQLRDENVELRCDICGDEPLADEAPSRLKSRPLDVYEGRFLVSLLGQFNNVDMQGVTALEERDGKAPHVLVEVSRAKESL